MSPTLAIQLFGALRITESETVLTSVNTPRLHALLAYLALNRGAPQPRQQVAFRLWPDTSNAQARTNLRNLLHLLRRALPGTDRFLDDAGPSLHWRPDAPVTLDIAEFEQALDQARRAERAGDQPALREALERAVGHYRGPLLPSCYDDWIVPERERFHRLFATAADQLLVALEGEGDYRRAIGYAQHLLQHEPLDEATYRRLMRFHAWSGDRTGALRVYRTCAAVLERELAVAPSPATRDLYERLVKGEALPRPVTTPLPAPTPSDRPAHNLPLQLTSFIGREPALAEVTRLLGQARLVTLTGAGGCGKTRLALEVAATLSGTYTGGVWWVDLAPLTDPALVPQAVAVVLGVREQPGRSLRDTLIDHLRSRQVLLVLDNCEHVVAAAARLAEHLLWASPRLRVLATSRERLGLAGETTWPVPPLAAPAPEPRPALAALADQEAVRLFAARAATALPTFRLSERNAPAVAQVCWRLDGLPLAIELAAARVRMLTVEQIAGRLDEALPLLGGATRTVLPRHQTMRAAIDWSYALLTEPERVILRGLSVFAGGFTLDAAERVVSGPWAVIREHDPEPPPSPSLAAVGSPSPHAALGPQDSTLELLAHLIDKSLVLVIEHEPLPGGMPEARYRLLETVRQYARDQLQTAGEATAIQARHAWFFLDLAEVAEPALSGPDPLAWQARLDREHDNLRAALDWFRRAGNLDGALRLAAALWPFWYARGYLREGRRWLEEVLALAGTQAPAYRSLRVRVLTGAGRLAFSQADYGSATALLEEGLALGRQIGDQRQLATTLYYLGGVAVHQADYARAAPAFEESLALGRASGDKRAVAYTLNGLGLLASFEHRFDEAKALLNESLALNRELGDQLRAAYTLDSLGWMAVTQGDLTAAERYFADSLALLRDGRDIYCIVASLEGLGGVAGGQGRPRRAARLLGAAAALREAAGIGPPPTWESGFEAMIAAARADLGEAAFTTAYAEGGHLPLATAITEALTDTAG